MKQKHYSIALLSLFMLVLASCQKATNVFPEPTPEDPALVVRPNVSFQNTGGSTTIDIATNQTDWAATVADGANWITLTPVAGTPGKLTVAVAENSLMDERVAEVRIGAANGSLQQTLRVIQFGTAKKILFVEGSRRSINGLEQEFKLTVTTNCPAFDVEIAPEADWLEDVTPDTKAFVEYSRDFVFKAQKNPYEFIREGVITARATGLGEGAVANITVEQAPNVNMDVIPAKLLTYTGFVGNPMENLFDKNYATFAETGYASTQGATSTTLDVEVKADAIYQILYYIRDYPNLATTSDTRRSQYPADMTLYVQKANSTTWEKVKDIQMRGTGTQLGSKLYPALKVSEVPYKLFDGLPLTNVRKVRFVIKNGNSLTGENNQFWNSAEIEFMGVAATIADPVKVPIVKGSYSWASMDDFWPDSDGGPVSYLYDGIIAAANYWQTPYFDIEEQDAESIGKLGTTEDVAGPKGGADGWGTSLTFQLDKQYTNFSEIWWYARNSGTQVPSKFDILVDENGTGTFKLVKSFAKGAIPTPWAAPTAPTAIRLDQPVKAKAFQIYIWKTAATDNDMFMCATEIEAYIQP